MSKFTNTVTSIAGSRWNNIESAFDEIFNTFTSQSTPEPTVSCAQPSQTCDKCGTSVETKSGGCLLCSPSALPTEDVNCHSPPTPIIPPTVDVNTPVSSIGVSDSTPPVPIQNNPDSSSEDEMQYYTYDQSISARINTRSPSPAMRRPRPNRSIAAMVDSDLDMIKHLTVGTAGVQPSVINDSQETIGGIMMHFSDSEQDWVHYNNCVKTLRLLGSLAVRAYSDMNEDMQIDARVIFGGDTFDIEGGRLSSRVVTRPTISKQLVKAVKGRLKKTDVQFTAVMGNRDINKLRLLHELPKPFTHTLDSRVNVRAQLSVQTSFKCGLWDAYNTLIALLFPVEDPNLPSSMQPTNTSSDTPAPVIYVREAMELGTLDLFSYLKMVLIANMTMGASSLQSGSTTCGTYCGGFLNYFLDMCEPNETSFKQHLRELFENEYKVQTNETAEAHAARLGQWISSRCSNPELVSLAHEVIKRIHEWVGGYGTIDSANGDISMRTFLESYSGVFECADVGTYRVLAAHAGTLDFNNRSMIFKYPKSVRNNVPPDPPMVYWEYLVVDDQSDQSNEDLVLTWCDAVNDQVRNMIKFVYSVYDGKLSTNDEFTYEHKMPFTNTPKVVLGYYETFELLCLLGGPGNQGPVSTAMVNELLVPGLDGSTPIDPKLSSAYNAKPVTWLLGHNPFMTALYKQNGADDAVRTDTQYKRPSYAVSMTVNESIRTKVDATLQSIQCTPVLSETPSMNMIELQEWISSAPENLFMNNSGWRITCGPTVLLPTQVSNSAKESDGLQATFPIRMLIVTQRKGVKTFVTFMNDKDTPVESNATLGRHTIMVGTACMAIDSSIDLQKPQLLEIRSNAHLTDYISICQDCIEASLKPLDGCSSTSSYQMRRSWRIPFDANGMRMHCLCMSYVSSSQDALLGKELIWDTSSSNFKCR
jgi:hypothetical protein